MTPRRLRHQVACPGETGPNQSNPPTARPTVRGVFHRLEGSPRVRVTGPGKVHDRLEGLHEVPINILRVCGEEVCRLYHMSPGSGLLNVG